MLVVYGPTDEGDQYDADSRPNGIGDAQWYGTKHYAKEIKCRGISYYGYY